MYDRVKKTESGSKFWAIMARVAMIITIANGTVTIGDKVIHLLPGTTESAAVAER